MRGLPISRLNKEESEIAQAGSEFLIKFNRSLNEKNIFFGNITAAFCFWL